MKPVSMRIVLGISRLLVTGAMAQTSKNLRQNLVSVWRDPEPEPLRQNRATVMPRIPSGNIHAATAQKNIASNPPGDPADPTNLGKDANPNPLESPARNQAGLMGDIDPRFAIFGDNP